MSTMDSNMGSPNLWQEEVIVGLADLFERDVSVKSLLLVGSCVSRAQMDALSDVDFVMIVENSVLRRFTDNADWLSPFGEVYAYALSESVPFPSLRVFFDDGRRLDFLFVQLQQLSRFMSWLKNPIRYGARTLFSRIAAQQSPPSWPDIPLSDFPPSGTIKAMANDFRFKSMLAVSKVARDDLLVATHLCLNLLADCVVLALMVRDKETAKNHHRTGDGWNSLIEGLPVVNHPGDPEILLKTIEQTARFFDALARLLCDDYQPQIGPLLEWIEFARRHRGVPRT